MTENREGDAARAEEEEELEEGEDPAILHLQRCIAARKALPWSELTLREKICYYADRIFLAFLAVVVLIFMGEAVYKAWWVTSPKAIYKFIAEIVAFFLTQEEGEELIEL